ncbi:MAG: phosphoribosyltransferase family protein [Bacteroidales bacterium]
MWNLLFPKSCLICENPLCKGEEGVCRYCLGHLPRTNFHLEKDNPAEQLFFGKCEIQQAASFCYFEKGNDLRRLIHEFKYRNNRDVAVQLGALYGRELMRSDWSDGIDLIVPVPLHYYKKIKRGYNQSEYIARGLSSALCKPLCNSVLRKERNAATQTRKTLYDRYLNADRSFSLHNGAKLSGKHLLLVDDVLTSGATLEACANTLLAIPDVKISIITLAFAE